jgi:hypothetical protein
MSRLAIRCDPQTAVAADEVERWLQREVERFRASSPRASVRLHRLSATESAVATGRGWLIELDHTCAGDPIDRDNLDAALRDMRLLGLRPTLLGTLGNSDAVPVADPVPST